MAKFTKRVKLTDLTGKFTWSTPYVHIVHRDRPWAKVGLNSFDIKQAIARNFNGNLSDAFTKSLKELANHFIKVINDYDWGREGKGNKRFRGGRTFRLISDSGKLRRSQKLRITKG